MSTATPMIRLDEYRPRGGRNYVRVGDLVAVTPPEKGRRFLAAVVRIDADDATGDVVQVHLAVRLTLSGAVHPRAGTSRCVTPDRIARIAQTRATRMRP